jgi:hypothetical protein
MPRIGPRRSPRPARFAPATRRHAGIAMCSVFLLGLLASPFAPETKGQPLPE